jgi:PhoD-like phosphatase
VLSFTYGQIVRDRRLTRREVLAAGVATGAAAALPVAHARARRRTYRLDFSTVADRRGWPRGWRTVGAANLRVSAGEGQLEAGSDVFPTDPRPVAFLLDRRFRDAEIRALLTSPGLGPGVILRRVGPRHYYAAIYDTEAGELLIVRRTGGISSGDPGRLVSEDLRTLASIPVGAATPPLTLALRATGARPTRLRAELLDNAGRRYGVEARDGHRRLQRPGDPGVLATSQTFLGTGRETTSPLGARRLLLAIQEGAVLLDTPAGQAYLTRVRESSTAGFGRITVSSAEQPRSTAPSVVAATSGLPIARGGRLNVASDVPAKLLIELSYDRRFRRSRTVAVGATGRFGAAIATIEGLQPGRRVYWRARMRRKGAAGRGPRRSFRVPPRQGDDRRVSLAVAACGSEFGPIFEQIAALRPDVLIWQGDLNYPDVAGPLAQTTSGYGGIWRDFLANPRMQPILARTSFVPQRDDHDYGLQDYNSHNDVPFGIGPWQALMSNRLHHRFAAGLVEVWVLDQRRQKSLPSEPDTPAKTLLGRRQRRWLLRTLAESPAPFKVICSPCTLHFGDNARDGNWGNGFVAERDLLLRHIARNVSGRTIFVSGDSHDTMVYDRDGVFEVRACPLDIPTTRDHPGIIGPGGTPAEGIIGSGVAYADLERHFCAIEVGGSEDGASMRVSLVKEDGSEPYTRRFEQRTG